MQGPDDEFRTWVGARADEIENEDELERLLLKVERSTRADVEHGDGENAEEDLAAILSWASVASYAVARFYGPASPWPRNVAGWGQRAAARLQRIAHTLSSALQRVTATLGASSFSISVNFPWGISIGLSW